MKLTEYLNAINHSKESLMATEDESVEKEYVPFVVNRCLSYFPDTIYFVNEVNKYHMLPKNMQFDFLRLGVRKNKRYSSWTRLISSSSTLDTRMLRQYKLRTYYQKKI